MSAVGGGQSVEIARTADSETPDYMAAVRYPRGKVHRWGYKPSWARFAMLVCGRAGRNGLTYETFDTTAPEDRCRVCFPNGKHPLHRIPPGQSGASS